MDEKQFQHNMKELTLFFKPCQCSIHSLGQTMVSWCIVVAIARQYVIDCAQPHLPQKISNIVFPVGQLTVFTDSAKSKTVTICCFKSQIRIKTKHLINGKSSTHHSTHACTAVPPASVKLPSNFTQLLFTPKVIYTTILPWCRI